MRIFTLLLVACSACAPKPREAGKNVIDINGILDKQLARFELVRPQLTKEAGVNSLESSKTMVPDKGTWKSELEVFRSLGMVNQRVYADKYVSEGPLDDPHSNLLVSQYTSQEASVKLIRLYYQDEPHRVRMIEGKVEERSLLFVASRQLRLWFEDDRGELLLNRYEITGFQKTALRDTVHFSVSGRIQW